MQGLDNLLGSAGGLIPLGGPYPILFQEYCVKVNDKESPSAVG
jgi:hypothetical protein